MALRRYAALRHADIQMAARCVRSSARLVPLCAQQKSAMPRCKVNIRYSTTKPVRCAVAFQRRKMRRCLRYVVLLRHGPFSLSP